MHEYISTTGPMRSNGLNGGEISREETTRLSVRPPFCGNRKRKTNLFASSILADVCSSTAGGTTLKKPEALSTVSMLDPPTCKFCVCEYSRVLHKVPPLSSFGHRETKYYRRLLGSGHKDPLQVCVSVRGSQRIQCACLCVHQWKKHFTHRDYVSVAHNEGLYTRNTPHG